MILAKLIVEKKFLHEKSVMSSTSSLSASAGGDRVADCLGPFRIMLSSGREA